jgi:hypothetical protein
MKSRTTRQFRELLAALPSHVRRQARLAYQLSGIAFKKVHPDPPIYSARVGIDYRAVCALDGDTAIWFWIGTHAEYDKLRNQL